MHEKQIITDKSATGSRPRTSLWLWLRIAGLFIAANVAGAQDPDRKLEMNETLQLIAGEDRVIIKVLPPESEFQGFGMIGNQWAFLAYTYVAQSEEEGGGAATVLSLFDVDSRKEYALHVLGATGDSSFQVSPDGHYVVFSWYKGIMLLPVSPLLESVSAGRLEALDLEKLLRTLVSCEGGCHDPRWEDRRRVVYRDSDGAYRVVTIEETLDGRPEPGVVGR